MNTQMAVACAGGIVAGILVGQQIERAKKGAKSAKREAIPLESKGNERGKHGRFDFPISVLSIKRDS